MELVYLWVEDYKNISKQGFDFSPRFECEYDEEKNELTINENKDYVSIFPDNINITAIVGENGSGKTNIVKCLGNNFSINKKIVFFSNGTIFTNFSLDFVNNKTHYKIEKADDNLSNLIFLNKNFFNEFTNNSIFSSLYLENNNLYLKYFDFDKNKLILNINSFYKKITQEILLKNYRTEFFNPTKINIKFNNLCKEYVGLQKEGGNNSLKDSIYRYKVYLKSFEIAETIKNIKALHTKEMKKFFKSSEEDILAYDYENDKDNNIKISLLVDKDENIYNFLDKYFLDKEIELLINKEFLFEEAKKLEFLMEEKDIEIFFYLNRIGFLDYDFFDGKKSFSSLSSGEKSFFSDTVILSKEIKDFLKYKDDKNSLILILDEPETTFHPQWQKKYIDYLISLINKNFTGNAHIILTSHSPFILSDLPKGNVIFLDKFDDETIKKYPKLKVQGLENGNCINVSQHIELKQTFGANIHTMLSHGFFMKDGLMGEFAKDKISQILFLLSNKIGPINIPTEQIKPIIEIIGEDFLREKLLKMYYEKFPPSKEERIKELKEELERLENDKSKI